MYCEWFEIIFSKLFERKSQFRKKKQFDPIPIFFANKNKIFHIQVIQAKTLK